MSENAMTMKVLLAVVGGGDGDQIVGARLW